MDVTSSHAVAKCRIYICLPWFVTFLLYFFNYFIFNFRRTWRTWRPEKRNRICRRLRRRFLRGSSSSWTEKRPENIWLLSSGEEAALHVLTQRDNREATTSISRCLVLCASPSQTRCFGGQVSWDKSVCIGSTYDVTDETITHQVVDRPNVDKQYINRYLFTLYFFYSFL